MDFVGELRKKVKQRPECSVEIDERPEGGVYVSCRKVSCRGDCKLYLVQDANGRVREVGCECERTPMAGREPTKRIEADNWADYQRKVGRLPEQPVGDGTCQLVREDRGAALFAICRGACDSGECITKQQVGPGDHIVTWCVCE